MTDRSPKPWDRKNPPGVEAHTKLTPEQIERAKQRAAAAGRAYPKPGRQHVHCCASQEAGKAEGFLMRSVSWRPE